MVPAHKVAGAPAPRNAEARLDGAGRSQLRAIKVAVRNVGGMSADTLFIRACRLAGRIDILVLIEVKVRGLDELRALVKMIFPEDTPDVVGVPCERDVHLAADGTQARQEVYGGIVAIILNRNIRATLTKEYDGVVSVACETAGMRPFCIIGCYLPPAPKAGKCRRRFLTVPARLTRWLRSAKRRSGSGSACWLSGTSMWPRAAATGTSPLTRSGKPAQNGGASCSTPGTGAD